MVMKTSSRTVKTKAERNTTSKKQIHFDDGHYQDYLT